MERHSRLSINGRPLTSTPTGRTKSGASSASSMHRGLVSSSLSNHTFPKNLPLKKLRPEPWQRLFDGDKRPTYSQQGFTLKRNKQNVDAIISEDFFHLSDERLSLEDTSQRSSLPPAVQAHIDHLSEQIDDLALQLAEERLNHKQARIKTEEAHANELQHQNKQFQELLHRTMIEHERTCEEQNLKHQQALIDEQLRSANREQQLKSELDFVKSSFHTYKINLDKENAEMLQIKIDEALEMNRKEFQTKEEDMARRTNDTISKERKNVAARQKIEIENLRKQHQKEIDTIHKNFADTAYDRARVESLSKELTATKLELEDTKDRATNLAIRLKDIEIQHIEATRELKDFRMRFDEKTKEIETMYAGRLDRLHLQNADLRNLFMKKCAELIDERALTQRKIAEQVKFTRKQLRRKLLDVRIASVIPLNADTEPHLLRTRATASQYERSSTRSKSAFARSHPVSAIYDERSSPDSPTNSPTNFTLDNQRRETKFRRRTSVPITEEEQDIVRYLTSTKSNSDSRYNFENQPTMIKNLNLDELQQTFN